MLGGCEGPPVHRSAFSEAGRPWAEVFWRADGALKPLEVLNQEMARLHPHDLREALGLPDGAAAP